MTLARDKISAVDTAWLRMDRPHNLMMICGVLLLDRRVDPARLRSVVQERFLLFRRFRQRAAQMPGFAFWQTVSDLDLDAQVVTVALPGRAGKQELEVLVSRLVATPLNPARPMWQFHLVENFQGGSALVARIHHSYADGMALVRVMLSMTDAAADGPPAMPFEPRRRDAGDDSPFAALLQPVDSVMQTARVVGVNLLERVVELWHDPGKAAGYADQASALTREIAHLALMPQDSVTRFKGKPGVAKRVAWADPLPLSEVKTIAKALAASVNDVLLACVAGALRTYLVEKGEDVTGVAIRALVPVNLRPPEKAYQLGNRFGLVFLELPIGTRNPIERLYQVRSNMRALKGSYQPLLAMGILAAMGAAPRRLQAMLLKTLARNATAVMTNVPGPQRHLYIAGARIESIMFWVPQSGDIGMGVSILSYADGVQFGLVTDQGLCPDPQAVIERFGEEFENLVLATLMAPWPRDGDLDPEQAENAVRVAT